MASNARSFFAGVGTTFVILSFGFGGGLLMANSALKTPTQQSRSSAELLNPVRVILPTTAEAAQPPQMPIQQVAAVEPEPVKAPENRVEKVDTKKAEMEARERRRHKAERKARQVARAKRQVEPREAAPVMAFGGDSFSPFGN
jgi:type IV secretory pathway VirB10-like protein